MRKSDGWYRNDRWGEAEETKFLGRLKRLRGARTKATVVRMKAAMLEAAGDPPRVRGALALLARVLREWPVDSELALCHWQMARCFLILKDDEAALRSFGLALLREREDPRVLTGAWSDFAQFVVSRKLREHYGDVRRLLQMREKYFIYPADRFVAHACRALIARENGAKGVAREEAERALAEAERPHENLGLLQAFDGLVQRLRKIAR
jgi:hypothetical protein